MPQLQLPIFPAGAKCITNEIAAECRDKQVVYLYGSLPVFQHAEGDLQSFRLITSQLIDMGAVRQVDIVNAFGVSATHREAISETVAGSRLEGILCGTEAAVGIGVARRSAAIG